SFDISPDLPVRVFGDQVRLRQIMTNLLGNAAKFTSQGKISMELRRMVDEERPGTVRIACTVRDTGVGISAQKLQDIFIPFVQGDMSTTKRFGGTGLGMAICKQLVELMDGRISVMSQEGKGSEFVFVVTLKDKRGDVSVRSKTAMVTVADLRGMKILVVEDSLPNCELIKAFFEVLGCEADYAANGQEALDHLKQDVVYDVCLMDVQMPVMDGLSATRIIRSEISQTLPVIALTAGAMPGDVERCLDAGMTAYLSKPLNFEVLRQKLLMYKPK
ncbi:MAG: ATP-binding protein, partial [Candidatus Omnitrophota bacterium]